MKICAIVLAAGCSFRMGQRNKLVELVDGRPMLHHVLEEVTASNINNCYLVTGFESNRIGKMAADYNLETVFNPDFKNGLSTSIECGIQALADDVDAVIIVPGDMPELSRHILNDLIQCFKPDKGNEICIPVFNNRRGNPVLWSRRFFSDLCNIQGDVGGRRLLPAFSQWVKKCPVDDASIHFDIDTEEQLNDRRNRSRIVKHSE